MVLRAPFALDTWPRPPVPTAFPLTLRTIGGHLLVPRPFPLTVRKCQGFLLVPSAFYFSAMVAGFQGSWLPFTVRRAIYFLALSGILGPL